jgi:hypothetical protein
MPYGIRARLKYFVNLLRSPHCKDKMPKIGKKIFPEKE